MALVPERPAFAKLTCTMARHFVSPAGIWCGSSGSPVANDLSPQPLLNAARAASRVGASNLVGRSFKVQVRFMTRFMARFMGCNVRKESDNRRRLT